VERAGEPIVVETAGFSATPLIVPDERLGCIGERPVRALRTTRMQKNTMAVCT